MATKAKLKVILSEKVKDDERQSQDITNNTDTTNTETNQGTATVPGTGGGYIHYSSLTTGITLSGSLLLLFVILSLSILPFKEKTQKTIQTNQLRLKKRSSYPR